MYHYTESGLSNVWLSNGYTERVIHGQPAVSISDADQLHHAIGRALALKGQLSSDELRFLRKELGLSQARLGLIVGASEQTVSLWERRGRIPVSIQRLVKFIYLAQLDGNEAVCDALTQLIELDASAPEEKFVFEDTKTGWKEAA
mgnify:CR=1 FL=1